MAWCRAPGSSPSPVIARQSCYRRRLRSVKDVGVDLACKQAGVDVQEMRTIETKREGGKGGAGVVGARPELRFLPAVMAARRGQARAAWRRLARVFGGEKKRGGRGLYGHEGLEPIPRISPGFDRVWFGYGVGRERAGGKEGERERAGAGKNMGQCWAGPEGWLGLASSSFF